MNPTEVRDHRRFTLYTQLSGKKKGKKKKKKKKKKQMKASTKSIELVSPFINMHQQKI